MHSLSTALPVQGDLQPQPGHARGKPQESNSVSQPAKLTIRLLSQFGSPVQVGFRSCFVGMLFHERTRPACRPGTRRRLLSKPQRSDIVTINFRLSNTSSQTLQALEIQTRALVLNSMRNQSTRLIFLYCSQQLKSAGAAQCTIQRLWVHLQVQASSPWDTSVDLCGIAVYQVGREPAFSLL